MDIQLFIACLAVSHFAFFAVGYVTGHLERKEMSKDRTEIDWPLR